MDRFCTGSEEGFSCRGDGVAGVDSEALGGWGETIV